MTQTVENSEKYPGNPCKSLKLTGNLDPK